MTAATTRRGRPQDPSNVSSWQALMDVPLDSCVLIRTRSKPDVVVGRIVTVGERTAILRVRTPGVYERAECSSPYERAVHREVFRYFRPQDGLWQHAIEQAARLQSFYDWRDPTHHQLTELSEHHDVDFVRVVTPSTPGWRGIAEEQLPDGWVQVRTKDAIEIRNEFELLTPEEAEQLPAEKPGRWPLDPVAETVNLQAFRARIQGRRERHAQ